MKRIAFMVQPGEEGWLGGLNYRRNLLQAVLSNPDRRIEPVLVVHPAIAPAQFAGFPDLEIIRSSLASGSHLARRFGRVARRLIHRDPTLEWLMRRQRIDALSHSVPAGSRSALPSIVWIADFQHLRMPQFFSVEERRQRDVVYMQMIRECTRVVLSSQDAASDFARFAPDARDKASVLHFVSGFESTGATIPEHELKARFGIERNYFHLPNQFWKHKNHALVIDALGILKRKGTKALVVATGKTEDYRNPDHFQQLLARARDLGVEDCFRALGVVSLPELKSLMFSAIALINPSDFEGWSTSVEEAKSLGLKVILSDIPVHIEQAPRFARYFAAGSAEELADAMSEAMREHDPGALERARQVATEDLPARVRRFGRAYEDIAIQSLSG